MNFAEAQLELSAASASIRGNRNSTFVAFLILILTQGNAQILLGQNLHLTLAFSEPPSSGLR